MKKIFKLACLFLCLLIIGTFTVACGGGGGGSSSGGGFGYIPAVTPDNPINQPSINPAYQSVTLNDEVLQQLYEIGLIETTDKAEFDKNKLTSIDIPATYTYNGTNYQITAIADKLFYNCVNLKKVTIPDTVSSIGDFAFWNVDHIYYNKAIPYNRYGWGALNVNDDKYKEVDLEYSDNGTNQPALSQLRELGNYLPENQLVTVHIPAIYIHEGTKYKIVSIAKPSLSDNRAYFRTHITPQYLHIPASVTYIGGGWNDGTFSNLSGLEGVDIPDSVTYIGDYCFFGCSSLKNIKFPNKIKIIKEATLGFCYSLTKVIIPDSVTTIEDMAFQECKSLKHIDIPDSVTTIGYNNNQGVFKDCVQLESIKLSNNLQNLYRYTFQNCTALKSITIPKSVITLGNFETDNPGIFQNCTSLKSVIIEEGSKLTIIGTYVFVNCTSLENINIPSSVTKIGYGAFQDCTSLIVEIPDSVVQIGGWAFRNVPHIYYTGIATGAPWEAKALN